jgi:hypothetical protein
VGRWKTPPPSLT